MKAYLRYATMAGCLWLSVACGGAIGMDDDGADSSSGGFGGVDAGASGGRGASDGSGGAPRGTGGRQPTMDGSTDDGSSGGTDVGAGTGGTADDGGSGGADGSGGTSGSGTGGSGGGAGESGGSGGTTGGSGGSGGHPGVPCHLYVSQAAGSDMNTGASWNEALENLSVALQRADGDNGCEIWVAAGTYHPDGSAPWQDGNEALTFQLRSQVNVYGGFAGDETSLEERDVAFNETILSGDLEQDDDPGDPLTYERNAHHVVTGASGAILDGFTITAGVAGGDSALFPTDFELFHGAGLINRGTSPTVRNCTFRSNTAYDLGGGIYNGDFSLPTIVDCTFEDNHATQGGAMANAPHSVPLIQGCEFLENEADLGGAITNEGSYGEIRDCTFYGNHQRAVVNRFEAGPLIVDSTFTANVGAMYNDNAYPSVVGCSFVDNTSSAIINYYANATFVECTFEGNSTTSQGGAAVNHGGYPTFSECLFLENSATGLGGGALWTGAEALTMVVSSEFRSNDGGVRGGAVGVPENGWIAISNSAFTDNHAEYGGAISVEEGVAIVNHSTFHMNQGATSGDAFYVDSAMSQSYLGSSIVWPDDFVGNVFVTRSNTAQTLGAEDPSNLHEDPLFALGDLGLRLQAGSPCIDTGDTMVLTDSTDVDDDLDTLEILPLDVAGSPRVSGTQVDMGAYEYQSP